MILDVTTLQCCDCVTGVVSFILSGAFYLDRQVACTKSAGYAVVNGIIGVLRSTTVWVVLYGLFIC